MRIAIGFAAGILTLYLFCCFTHADLFWFLKSYLSWTQGERGIFAIFMLMFGTMGSLVSMAPKP